MTPWIKEKWPEVSIEDDNWRFGLMYDGWVILIINEHGLSWRHLLRPIPPGSDVWKWTDLSPADPEYFAKFTEIMNKAFEFTKIEAKLGTSVSPIMGV